MRKADYAALAAIIKEWRAHYHASPTNPHHCTPAVEAIESLAREFADRASVDKSAFLKACGIDS